MNDNEKKYKTAFMNLLGDYVSDTKSENVYVDSFCERCPLQKKQTGGCSLNLNTDYSYVTCAEGILKWYLENSND